MSTKPVKTVGWGERISYGLGGTASHFTFSMVSLFLMYFYTDVAGIAPAAIATLLFVMRIWDGVNDPLMGIIIDRTRTKWGKCRPYFLWMAIPYGIIAVLLFSSPFSGATAKIIFAYVTYFLYDIIYTAINLPLAAVLPTMTESPNERNVLNSTRMFLAMCGTIIVTLFTMKLVGALGGGNAGKGFIMTMSIFGGASIIMWLLTFSKVKERVVLPQKKEDVKLKNSLKTLTKNGPWWMLLCINAVLWVGMTMQQSTALYFFKYNLQAPQLASVFMTVSALCSILGILTAPILAKKLGKIKTFIIGNCVSIFGLLVMAILGSKSIPMMFVGALFCYWGSGSGTPLIYSMLADSVEYGEWKTGIRAEGLIFSAASFGVKFGMGIGSAISALLLTIGNYVANTVQTAASLSMIRISYLIAPIACMTIITIILFFYKLDEKTFFKIRDELIQKRGVIEVDPTLMGD